MQETSELPSWLTKAEFEANARVGRPLRPLQREVLGHLAAGKHLFANLPTGYGKSLCYWAPAVAWGWRVWVVSPLVSLIEDQAMACENLGVTAVALHSGLTREEREHREQQIFSSNAVLFLSPERLQLWQASGRLSQIQGEGLGPDLLALDEMHCFEEWREFRQSYQSVFSAIKRIELGGALILGLSASLAERESRAWMAEFCESFEVVSTQLGRDNLTLRVFPIEEEGERWLLLASLLREKAADESIILYCCTRKECDDLARWLGSLGYPSCTYHAGLPPVVREARSRAFREGRLPFLCATSAFGMGIDFPRVARVIHFSTPYDLESYWQEAGRAGRDGRQAFACAIFRRSDIARAQRMSERQKHRFANLWSAWLRGDCRKRAVAAALGMTQENCGRCDRCDVKANQLPSWLQEATSLRTHPAWWTNREAASEAWAREKIFYVWENS